MIKYLDGKTEIIDLKIFNWRIVKIESDNFLQI